MTNIVSFQPDQDPASLQRAIEALAAQGGGKLVLPAGEHRCGPVRLLDNIELHLSAGAVLSPIPDYGLYEGNTSATVPEADGQSMIYAREASNIAITGSGIIDGGGSHFIAGDDVEAGVFIPAEPRLKVIVLEGCNTVRLGEVTIRESSAWTLHLIHCDNVVVDGYRVLNDMRMPNTDGLVLDGCTNVTVRNAIIRTADDGIVLKTGLSTPQRHCADITISNCVIESGSCAIKIGTETFGDFDRISVDDCTLEDCNRGLGILSRDGGRVTDVSFRNVSVDCHETPYGFWGSGEALTITQLDRRTGKPAGRVSRVTVENLTGTMEGAVNFYAAKSGDIDTVTLTNVRLTQRVGKLGTGLQYDIRPTEADLVPSADAAGRVGAWIRDDSGKIVGLVDYPDGLPGVFAHNVTGLVLDDVHIERPQPLPRGYNPAMVHTE